MSADLEFTGERYVPGTAGEIAHEHWHRYAFARRFVAGRRVADVACGEGYGGSLLAESAASVAGIDIDAATLAHARSAYATRGNMRFLEGSASALPLDDASVDVVVSFETIEHLDAEDQPKMIAEFARVLVPQGIVILSSPNRPEYSDARQYVNPFHRHELDRDELHELLMPHFPAQRWHRQRRYFGSAVWSEEPGTTYEAAVGDATGTGDATPPPAMYFVVVAARSHASLPAGVPALSLFTDRDDRELARLDREAREALRLDGILRMRDAQLKEQMSHSRDLEGMVEYRNHRLAELEVAERALREELAQVTADCDRTTAQVAAQERIIAYRESFRWWLTLPWLIARRVWRRIRSA